jgi:hypothetical protein
VHATFSSHQLTGTFSDLCVRCFGLHGSADTHYGGLVRILSDDPAKTWTGAQKDDTFTGILGRMAAYRGGAVTWDEMMASTEKWEARLKLQW